MSSHTNDSNTYTTSSTTSVGPDGRPNVTTTQGYNLHKSQQSKPKTVYTNKFNDEKFNFKNTTIENAAINNDGPVTFNTTKELYEKGAQKHQFDISGGTFAQANLGGEAKYNNKDTRIAAGSGGVGSRGDWSFNVDQAVLEILKGGVTPEQMLEALLKGKKIKDLWNYVQKCKQENLDIMFDSFLNYEEDDDMDTST